MIRILGIETSCDETAIAVLEVHGNKFSVTAEEISSQHEVHEAYGGVVPELASREHMRNLPLIYDSVLAGVSLSIADFDFIAVTVGPGLKGCLLMGLEFARGVSTASGVPLVGVNHIEGHVLAPLLDNPDLTFPFLALVVSGGHSEIVQVDAPGKYLVLARTTDDAAGEAFDKSAALLGIPYPGGPALARLADSINSSRFTLPKVMREAEGYSFSGLKTAIRLLVEKENNWPSDEQIKAEIAYAIQDSIVDALVFKLKKAIKKTGIKTIAITGGVSANRALREAVKALPGVSVYVPKMIHCMDNAAMIAYAGYYRFGENNRHLDADPIKSRWPVEQLPPLPERNLNGI